jgi:hypothetical protein
LKAYQDSKEHRPSGGSIRCHRFPVETISIDASRENDEGHVIQGFYGVGFPSAES